MSNFKIPNSQGQIRTIYQTDKYGELWETFGINLDSIGKIKSNGKMVKVKDSTDDENFGTVTALVTYGTNHYAFTGNASGNEFYICDVAADPTNETNWVKVNSSIETGEETDAVVFDGDIVITTATDIANYDGTTMDIDWWTNVVGASALTSLRPHAVDVLRGGQETLFVTDGNKARYYNTTAGASIVTLQNDLVACCLAPARDSMYVGTFSESNNNAIVYEIYVGEQLDGTPVARYGFEVDGSAVLWLEVIAGIPYVLTDRGNIQMLNGASFITIATMPFAFDNVTFEGVEPGNIDRTSKDRPVHHDGSDTHNGSVFFSFNGKLISENKTAPRVASGVWEFDTETRQVIHRSPFVESVDQNGVYIGEESGPLMVIDGDLSFMLGGFQTLSGITGLFAEQMSSKYGYFTTIEIESGTVRDAAEQAYIKAKRLTGSDNITLKYRTTVKDRQCVIGTLANANTFNTTETVDVEVGDEVIVLNGTNAGEVAEVTKVNTSASVTSLELDTDIGTTGASVTVGINNFTTFKNGTSYDLYDSSTGDYKQYGADAVSTFIQFKVYLNGDVEMREFIYKGTAKNEL